MTDPTELNSALTERPPSTAEQMPSSQWPYAAPKKPLATLLLKDNDLLFISDNLGNLPREDGRPNASLGLFCRDTRFLSYLELQIEGRSPTLLSSNANQGFALSVSCTNPWINDQLPVESIWIQRDMVLQGGLFEEITLTNYSMQSVQFELSLSLDADFVDLFEIRGWQRQRWGKIQRYPWQEQSSADAPELRLAYQGIDQIEMESRIRFLHRPPDQCQDYTARWHVNLAPHETEVLGYWVQPLIAGQPASATSGPTTLSQAIAAEAKEEQGWRERITHIRSDKPIINTILEQAEKDLFLLGQTFGKDNNTALSAGVPWFAALFGRDALIAATQTLMLDPELARQTLTVLAQYQGKKVDPWREEEPGKILHELRLGEMARCGEIPHTPYYGTVDATPLWLLLYCKHYAWTGDRQLLDDLWDNALAAMEWIDRSSAATGYLTYQCLSPKGVLNQGWKDTEKSMVDRHGNLAKGAIALSEVQGYVYAARMQMAAIASLKQRPDLAERWQQAAQDLKQRFTQDFWMPDQRYIALALDGEGRPVDSITSNPGHCLGLGILQPEQALAVAERLQAPDMFSGWGIRTLSSESPAYNPMGYHLGSVWPHDNGIIATGLRTIGRTEQALAIAQGILDMTARQRYYRPPELLCGTERTPTTSPVAYPVACSPQAWSTGCLFQLLQVMVNLQPDAPNGMLRIVRPSLPPSIQYLSVNNLHIGQTRLDLEFEQLHDQTACRVVRRDGDLQVVIEV
ncbi:MULTISPECIES: amylo-alpha-1,6-glucosidase [unclassified Leptolyngbya]|uniref:amylo-alpha-1,6-glucosidase n=1 Tax=unclassified Leptolyngbya TaxID=2650499 RepID=UPI00168919D8|nr:MULTISPECIES: amylo-alpha-1,6-glucosidase [unclassified Leptolyngbya]MBD1909797.1 amylo-alpha-1,6-glucosidase [Leptolyngbya sp. FACHB-8]MBD2158948.1 amylo-alpha-1,6-glucosidase [Leptolyngbya sp. FACHB-16]